MLAAVIGALVLPTNGRSVPVPVGLAAGDLATGVAFAALTRRLHLDRGTESLRTAAAPRA